MCASGGDRAIVITPAKGVFFCFAAREGGDLIALAAHIRKVDVKDAAAWLDGGTVPSKKEGSGNQVPPKGNSSLEPLAYLEHEHVAVEALGFAAEDAKALGIGYCPKGIMRGTLAVPVRLEDGTLAGYIGITEAKLPPMAVLAALPRPRRPSRDRQRNFSARPCPSRCSGWAGSPGGRPGCARSPSARLRGPSCDLRQPCPYRRDVRFCCLPSVDSP